VIVLENHIVKKHGSHFLNILAHLLIKTKSCIDNFSIEYVVSATLKEIKWLKILINSL
jgi:hypothetical protein